MTEKLAAIILDALGPYNIRQLDMEYLQRLNKEHTSGLMTVSGLAHTPISNARLWGQYRNEDRIWVDFSEHKWTGGVDGFDPVERVKEDRADFYEREDFPVNFVWDVLDYRGYDACALGIPFLLPPYSFNEQDSLDDEWFPHTEDTLERHVTRKFDILDTHIDRGYDFIATSIKVPDQWLHGKGSGRVDDLFIEKEVERLEKKLKPLIERLEDEGYDWLLFGDHGSPINGRTLVHESKNSIARHRKDALIIGSTDSVPRYTDNMKPFLLDYFNVEDVPYDGRRASLPSVEVIADGA